MEVKFLNKLKPNKKYFAPIARFFAMLGRFFSRVGKAVWDFLCRSKRFARFAYVTFPARRKSAHAFLDKYVLAFVKKYRYKIVVPAAVFVAALAVAAAVGNKDTENSDYYAPADEVGDFGMVLQHYSTFDHSEKTHIAVKLSWENGAVNLQDGRALSRIKATVYPVNLKNPQLEWSSSDEEIAVIDSDGKIEASAPGRVEIYAKLVNYGKNARAKLSVRQPVTGIILPTSTMTLYNGGSARYLNARIFPANATNKNVTWSSKNTRIARVDNNGTVKPVGIGMTEITAVTEDGSFEGRCFVTVVNPSVDVEEISLQNGNDMNIRVGESINAIVTVSPSNARNKTLRWSSDNEAVASVSQTGRIRGVSEGTAYITAESVNGKKQRFMVLVGESNEKDPFVLRDDDDAYEISSGVIYTPYNVTFPQAVHIQMSQNPAPKIWTYGGGISASEGETAEYMNPNNYYTDEYKFQFLDLGRPNGVSEEALNMYLSDKGVLRGMGKVFIEAAKEYNVSEVYLAAHACLESGNGTSQLALGVEVNGEVVYNLFGIAAVDSDPLNGGSQKAYREGWTSVESAIMGGARWISEYYINSADMRQNTLYKMLWNPADPGYHQYATDIGWAVKQAVSIGKIFNNFPEAALMFDVPVYNGMIPPTLSTE